MIQKSQKELLQKWFVESKQISFSQNLIFDLHSGHYQTPPKFLLHFYSNDLSFHHRLSFLTFINFQWCKTVRKSCFKRNLLNLRKCHFFKMSLLIGENPGHVTFIYKKSCDNMTVAHCFPFAKGSNGILV